jgi:uncharacterized protein
MHAETLPSETRSPAAGARPALRQLGVFAKYWQPGEVKTRLAAQWGDVAASRMYRGFLVAILNRFGMLAERRVLAFTPLERRNEFAELAAARWELEPQAAGDLGQRMRGYFEVAFAAGADRVVLVGSDSPTVPCVFVERAFALLETHDVALGPTHDGGYYLVGAVRRVPPIFEGVAWSTPHVWEQTMEQIRRAGLSHATLPPWYDVDEPTDLARLRAELASRRGEPEMEDLARLVEHACASRPS